MSVRIAAVGDVHVGADSVGALAGAMGAVNHDAHMLLLAGDLTRNGGLDEARVLLHELSDVRIPIVAVLGNHDYQQDRDREITAALRDGGITVLEGAAITVEVNGTRVGIAGTKGFGGGFVGACASDYGEPEMKAFVRHTQCMADQLSDALSDLDADLRIALLHFSPVAETLRGEPLEIYPFLGSYLLAEAIDRNGADLALHGHAHGGSPRGRTSGGCPVRNVAQPVIRHAYQLFCLGHTDDDECEEIGRAAAARAGMVSEPAGLMSATR